MMNFWQRKERAAQLRALPWRRCWSGAAPTAMRPTKTNGTGPGSGLAPWREVHELEPGRGRRRRAGPGQPAPGPGVSGAVDWLAQHRGQADPQPVAAAARRSRLRLPAPDPRWLERVRDYLVAERAIPRGLLEPLIEMGTLYDHEPTRCSCCAENRSPAGRGRSRGAPPGAAGVGRRRFAQGPGLLLGSRPSSPGTYPVRVGH